jgi:hypothetical protein
MERVIWIAGWEMQCCGKPFALGSSVSWPVAQRPDNQEFLTTILGPAATRVTHWYEAHEDPPRAADAEGTIATIDAVYCQYASIPGRDPRYKAPVPGSLRTEARSAGDGWEPAPDGFYFAGYVVTVVES